MDCRVLTTGVLDPERETSLDEVLATLELPVRRFQAQLGSGRAAEVIDLAVNGVRVTVMPTASSRAERSPDTRESAIFLELAEHVFDRFRPDVLLTLRRASGQPRADAAGAVSLLVAAQTVRRSSPKAFEITLVPTPFLSRAL
jgi:hypothetical protein